MRLSNLSNKMYDVLKWASIIFVPALITFVSTLGLIWGWDTTEQIVATISAFGTLLGALIAKSSYDYNNKIIQDPPNGTDDEEVVGEDEEEGDE